MELIQEADRSKWMMHSNHSIRCFTQGDIERMTNNYRTSLGRGAFGEVYEGVLEDDSVVAVKRLIGNMKEAFAKEFIVHREINHKNVVRLIGYCVEENALILVMEYIANGNLNDALHDDNRPIPLDIRLRIAIECAEALAYMHSHMYTQVIHGDIKPGNILLDGNFHAKLSDFGISRVVNTDKTLYTKNVIGSIGYMDPLFSLDGRVTVKYDVYSFGAVLVDEEWVTKITDLSLSCTTDLSLSCTGKSDEMSAIIGTYGYIAPEFTWTLRCTEKIDVYSFGIVLLETLSARRPNDVGPSQSFSEWALQCKEEGNLDQIVDPCLMGSINLWSLNKFAETAFKCVVLQPIERPSMQDVISDLEHALQWQESADASECAKSLPSYLCRQFWLAEMEAATNNFDKSLLIVSGLFDQAYHGKIDGVAITLVDVTHVYSVCAFHSLIEMTLKLYHSHVVRLIGYCDEQEMMLLVYEYMAGGNLSEHIYGTRKPPLNWIQRMEICIGVARGLCYLHGLQLTHGAVRASNILLDEEFLAKKSLTSISFVRPRTKCKFEKLPYYSVD